ncbi:glycosyltransferase [Kocuria coralli]|uniref:Glycosyltransferase n=1 Tax=Kocuria coralli TaxID=1461025 RepID=A0A5J5KW62_9MICC|nr:glycosyltransferase [Kocuria coralli]KAA9393091.1 glycosyltransferase [Kocuria coralli]
MKREQAQLRKTRVRRRIGQLEERKALAEKDRHWYQSESFARTVRRGDWGDLAPVRDPEDFSALMDRVLRRDEVADLQRLAADLPEHLGTRSLNPHPVRIAMIADQFLYDSLNGTADVTYLTPENFQDEALKSDLLLIASTWRGLHNEWMGATVSQGPIRSQVIPAFRDAGVPVAFYSKEDPPNYIRFLPLAREADYIFTSAEEVVDDYRRDCPDVKEVRALTFGVNPLVHNPVGSRRHRRQEVLFAGSWLDHKYPLRKKSARHIFDGVIDSGRDLLILDRNSTLGDSKYFYPQQYLEFVGPGVPHTDLMRIQRLVDVQINLNSVTDSATMFANRAVELQAMGAAVISNYSRALNNMFPNILITDSAFETRAMLEQLHGDELYRLQAQGVHRAFFEHTSHQRVAELLQTVGLPTTRTHGKALMVAEEVTETVRRIAAEQTMDVDVMSISELRHARAGGPTEHTVILPIREDYRYHHDYARSQVAAFAYADVDFVAKNGYESSGRVVSKDDHEPIGHADDPFRAGVWQTSSVTDRWLQSGVIEGSGYGTDPFGVDTWPEGRRTRSDAGGSSARSPELTVVVPVYNNGRHLENKCFRSLQRSSIFERMEILLVDDGSTDGITPLVVQDLERRFPQVKAYFNPPGGSGSASRPRNQGLEMASAPYITYLDPDNEAVNDGFARLLDIVKESASDFAIGDMLKFARTRRYVANSAILNKALGGRGVQIAMRLPSSTMSDINFQPMSIQALVASTPWLRGTGITQPIGALGQDSLAFQQMLHAAEQIDIVNFPIHVYYGAVDNSVVNSVSPGFFRKYIPLESARVRWLESSGLMDDYIKFRARPFFEKWFVHKYNNFVQAEDREACRAVLRELAATYGIQLEFSDPQDPTSDLYMVAVPEAEEPADGDVELSEDTTAQGTGLEGNLNGQPQGG